MNLLMVTETKLGNAATYFMLTLCQQWPVGATGSKNHVKNKLSDFVSGPAKYGSAAHIHMEATVHNYKS